MTSDSGTTKNLTKDPLEAVSDPTLKAHLKAAQQTLHFELVGVTPISNPITIDFYKNWIDENQYGDMNYLKAHLPFKENPLTLNENLNSAISIAFSYFPAYKPMHNDLLPKTLPVRTALYSHNEDYHFWLKDKLKDAIEHLQKSYPNEVFLPYVDSGPILERDLAYKAGLGWFGKNSCMINSQKGSLFFLGEILTSLKVAQPPSIHADLCGKCQKCIEACPTQAISDNKTLNASKCISYLTIEAKTVAPIELRPQIGDWFFGCDICQTVCPWNQKKLKLIDADDPRKNTTNNLNLDKTETEALETFLKTLLESSNKKIQKMFWGTPLLRSGGFGLKRNALIVIANRNLTTLKPQVEKYKTDPKLSELADWVLKGFLE
ncbi:MAG: tRNA epoxyqueuosine(34) reductase QueG [Pseudobdellovibrio sp.]